MLSETRTTAQRVSIITSKIPLSVTFRTTICSIQCNTGLGTQADHSTTTTKP